MSEVFVTGGACSNPGWEGRVRLPDEQTGVPQDREWCEVLDRDRWRRLRFHDYHEIYGRPGLYEHLFYGLLQCRSPKRVIGLLEAVRRDRNGGPFRAIDLGAGNGIVGEELRRTGAVGVIGVDILAEAREAALRDRPGVYDEYLVDDLTAPRPVSMSCLERANADALVCVAALGFGDIPPLAFFNAANAVRDGGYLAFNIKDEFLDEAHAHGFSEMVRRMLKEKAVRLEAWVRYRHRLSASGEPIFYTAIVMTKLQQLQRSVLVEP
jgi:predicted TPR repeat methyltransferase